VIGRSEEYFDNVENFDPYRWINPKTNIHPMLHSISFGYGNRGCIG
jgi:cytochrome P450